MTTSRESGVPDDPAVGVVPPTQGERFHHALGFARRLHAKQVRKHSGVSYFSHLLSVCALVMESGGTEDECIAALLHDALEDQAHLYPGGAPALNRTIAGHYGDGVLFIVRGCTDSEAHPKPAWRPRKESFLARLAEAPYSVRVVANADKLHNARCVLRDHVDLGPALWRQFAGGRDGTLWYYDALANILGADPRLRFGPDLVDVVERIHQAAGAEPDRIRSGR
jgi:(p)ppGpp synthase/HD superfamily hydrolase